MGRDSEAAESGGQRLTVGFLIDRWDPERGGAERAMAALAAHLEARGHRVLAFAREGSAGAPGELMRVAARGLSRVARERALARALVETATEARCDVTIGMRHLERVDLYWPHDGAYRAAFAARLEAEGRAADTPPRGRHTLFLELERALLERGGARRVVCVSELVRRELADLYPACRERLVLIENGVDLERFHTGSRSGAGCELRAELGIDAQTPLLVFAGADARRKGLPELLTALGNLIGHQFTVLVAGVRHAGMWRRLAGAQGIPGERMHFRERVDAATLWAAADLCVLPTWRDASGLVILEALASGVPVVTTRRAGAADAIVDERAGSVLEHPGDVEALREVLATWLARLAQREPDREAVRACVRERGARLWLERLEEQVLALGARAS